MSDAAPEDPLCPCGSGLKLKRCHGSIIDPAKAAGNLPLNATAFRAGLAGFPGQLQQMHVVNQFPDDDPRSSVPAQGAPGLYEVVFVLKRPGFPLVGERPFAEPSPSIICRGPPRRQSQMTFYESGACNFWTSPR